MMEMHENVIVKLKLGTSRTVLEWESEQNIGSQKKSMSFVHFFLGTRTSILEQISPAPSVDVRTTIPSNFNQER